MDEGTTDNTGGGRRSDAPRLTDVQKKENHIKSEKKRRDAIREGFDRFAGAVGMPGQGRSEAAVMSNGTRFLKSELANRYFLVEEAKTRGINTKEFEYDPETMKLAEQYALEGYGKNQLAQQAREQFKEQATQQAKEQTIQQTKEQKTQQAKQQTIQQANQHASRQTNQQSNRQGYPVNQQSYLTNPQGYSANQQDRLVIHQDHPLNEQG
ncbi:MAG: hypothetical protein M1831_001816 [Alyxoria varia]|nr:MAG: hypothetical protein M1831_001816 [Alyxoria varia]